MELERIGLAGTSWQNVLRTKLGDGELHFVYRTQTTAINTGKLDTGWFLAKHAGEWVPCRFWQAELGESWLLICWCDAIQAATAKEAASEWQSRRRQINLQVLTEMSADSTWKDSQFLQREMAACQWETRLAERAVAN